MKKILFLFLALLLPICVFLFLKIFGKNEFAVKPLFQDVLPEGFLDCPPMKLPYKINAEILKEVLSDNDSLGLIYFKKDKPARESNNQLVRLEKEFKGEKIKLITADHGSAIYPSKKCVFLLNDFYDVVLVDNKGVIRGQYASDDREEIDRLITEVDIILKKY